MKVKVGNSIFDSEKEPIMLILTKEERDQIESMDPDDTKFCSYPDSEEWVENEFERIVEWMTTGPVL